MSANRSGIIIDGPDAAGSSRYFGATFSWNPDKSSTLPSTLIQITDGDGVLLGGSDATQQTLASDLLGDDTTMPAGTKVMASYSCQFKVGGVTHWIDAIQSTTSNAVIGYVSTFDLVPGTNYAITQADNTPDARGRDGIAAYRTQGDPLGRGSSARGNFRAVPGTGQRGLRSGRRADAGQRPDGSQAGGASRPERQASGRLNHRGARYERAGRDSPAFFRQNSTPGWPLMPDRKGCLTSVISVTRSAASISSGAAFRPVRQTWVKGGFSSRRKASTSSSGR